MTFAITVSGRVQGVFFRASTRSKAIELGLKGFVRNQPDGTVYIEASGNEENLAAFIAWCKVGPRNAVVENFRFEEITNQELPTFEIRR